MEVATYALLLGTEVHAVKTQKSKSLGVFLDLQPKQALTHLPSLKILVSKNNTYKKKKKKDTSNLILILQDHRADKFHEPSIQSQIF